MKDRLRAHWRALALISVPLVLAAGVVAQARAPRLARRSPVGRAPVAVARGTFRVSYGRAKSDEMASWATRLRDDSVLERAASRLNAFVSVPSDIELTFQECGDDDAYYEKGKVTFCYEEVADYADLLAPGRPEEPLSERETERVEAAATFFILHEAGHALVDVLALPVTGKEEDAVDQFAVYFLAEDGPADGREDALRAAEVLGKLARSESSSPGELPVWDVHSLDAQRQANLLCWVYGADSRTFGEAVRRAGLPRERRSSCEDEYAQLAGSWSALLAPYLVTLAAPVSGVGQQPRALR